jgi:hypothetical protein
MKPREIAQSFAKDHQASEGVLHLTISLNGRTKNYHYVVSYGEARQILRHDKFMKDWHADYVTNGGPFYWPMANGVCQRCGAVVLETTALRIYYEPFADGKHQDRPQYAPLYLCGDCVTENDLNPREFWNIRRAQQKHVQALIGMIPNPCAAPPDWTIWAEPVDGNTIPSTEILSYGPYAMAAGGAR